MKKKLALKNVAEMAQYAMRIGLLNLNEAQGSQP